ncbi:MAG: glutaredoxin family protein [Ignavibacteriae bacterium]|nr:glutaredoxin family protein [Ignavibacteria bacterium]MBI3363416.1 glutaredoxin family protein [Ignavibacteriota bacterium]
MILVELYSKHDCHLCDIAKDTLIKIQLREQFELREIKIREGDAFYNEFKERIPVVYINGEWAFQYHVPEEMFIRKLKAAHPA